MTSRWHRCHDGSRVVLRSPFGLFHVDRCLSFGNRAHTLRWCTIAYRPPRPCGKALVLDTCMGVVTSAMLERMGCRGRIIALYTQSQPSMDAVSKRVIETSWCG